MRLVTGFQSARKLLEREVPDYGRYVSLLDGRRRKKEPPELRVVVEIVRDVRERGDSALLDYTSKLDGVMLDSLELSKAEISKAHQMVDKKLISALQLAADRIRDFHLVCKERLSAGFWGEGLGRQVRPLDRVGIYVPGGTASYPSTVLMTAIPARVAGVREIIMTTPPNKDGTIPPLTLVAAGIAGVDRIFRVGGAQAIAALAFGTESIPKVDKICGPGNIFVVLAKKLVFGSVAVEGLAGPSEIVIIADETADPRLCAADLLAQAEHDAQTFIALITVSSRLAKDVATEIKRQLQSLQRKTIVSKAVSNGVIAIVDSLDEAIELVNLCAPEHVSLMVKGAAGYTDRIRNAGCIFVGDCPAALGDYIAGPSHVLPTGGSARFGSPLGVEDFLKATNIIALDSRTSGSLSEVAIAIAEAEGLSGHARAIKIRML